MQGIAINEIEGAHNWDEDRIYQFMVDYLPELCPRNNETGKDLQMGIQAIRRGKEIIKALDAQGQVRLTLDRDKLIDFLSKQTGWKRMHVLPEGAEMLADALIANLKGLITVVKEGK